MMEPARAEMVAPGPGGTSVGGEAVAGAAITEDIIQGGEIVILDLRPHVGSILLRALPIVLAIVALALVSEMWLTLQPGRIVSVSGALIALVLAVYAVDWALTRYVLTDRRVMVIRGGSGFTGRIITEALVPAVHRLSLEHSMRESILGLGTLVFIPDHGERIGWEMLGRAEDVYAIARDTVERYGRDRLDE